MANPEATDSVDNQENNNLTVSFIQALITIELCLLGKFLWYLTAVKLQSYTLGCQAM